MHVVFVDGVRTPFGKAGRHVRRDPRRRPGRSAASASCCAATRSCRRSGSTRSPIAATTQIGDQGLTIGRTAALLAGLPKTVPGYAIDRMCAGAMTAVTTVAGGIAFGAYDVAIAGGVEHMGRHPMGEGVDPNPRILAEKLVDPSALVMGATAENLHDRLPAHHQGAGRRVRALASQEKPAKAYADGKLQPDLVPVATRDAEQGWGLATVDEAPRETIAGEARHAEDPVPSARQGHRRQRRRPQRRRHRLPARRPRTAARELGLPVGDAAGLATASPASSRR